jgi:nucleoid-associated protein YgaU
MVLGALVIIVVGVLVVNYFKERGGTLPFLPSGNKTEVTETERPKSVTVAAGDTLWAIAEKYYGSGYNWVDIAQANNLANPNLIAAGQTLNLPDVEPKMVTTATEMASTDTPISGGTYTVVRGDNLWEIAVRAYGDGYKWVEIAQENKLANPDIIHAGNILVLPR